MSERAVFPPPRAEGEIEWPGTQIGISNILTRTRSRTEASDKTIDDKPGLYERLMDSARRAMSGRRLFIHDVVIHGVRVRAHTNSHHLIDFWKQNWFGVEAWRAATGVKPPTEPRVNVHAFGGVDEQPEAAYYSRRHDAVIFFNTSYYGQLKSWVLGAVGRILAEESGIHSIHGAAAHRGGRGVLTIAPTGAGKSTSSYGLMDSNGTRFHSDDWVYVRYGFPGPGGEVFSPLEIPGAQVRGVRCFRWLEGNLDDKDRTVRALSLSDERVDLRVGDLDLRNPRADAFISEKAFYLRSNLVESFPEYAPALMASRLENVPDVTGDPPELDALVRAAAAASGRAASTSPEALRKAISRLAAFGDARAMLDVSKVFGRGRVFANPLEPMRIDAVFLLQRNPDDATVLESLPLDRFCGRLMLGETPDGPREIAYNAYRAVDDERELTYLRELERQGANVWAAHAERVAQGAPVPQTFADEFELFRVLRRCAPAYGLNTILQRRFPLKRDAVLRTIRIIAETLQALPEGARISLDDFEEARA